MTVLNDKTIDILWYETGWFTAIWIYMAVQAFLGILLFEWSWVACSRYRDVQEERDASYPTARRIDV